MGSAPEEKEGGGDIKVALPSGPSSSENTSREVTPSEENALMEEILARQGLTRKETPKDGACLFRAVSELLYGTQVYHQEVREDCVDTICAYEEQFRPFLDEGIQFEEYTRRMRLVTVWGGHLELQALSLCYQVNFRVHTSQGAVLEIDNHFPRLLHLAYLHGNHYDLVYATTTWKLLNLLQPLVYALADRAVQSTHNSELPPLDWPTEDDKPYQNIALHHWKTSRQATYTRDSSYSKRLARAGSQSTTRTGRQGPPPQPGGWMEAAPRRKKVKKANAAAQVVHEVPTLSNLISFDSVPVGESGEDSKKKRPKKKPLPSRKESNDPPAALALHDENLFPALGGTTTPSSSSSISHAPAGIWATRTAAVASSSPSSPSRSQQTSSSASPGSPQTDPESTSPEKVDTGSTQNNTIESSGDSPAAPSPNSSEEEIECWGSFAPSYILQILAMECPQVRLEYALPTYYHSTPEQTAEPSPSTETASESKSEDTSSTPVNEKNGFSSGLDLSEGFIPSASVIRSMESMRHGDANEFYPSPGMVSVPPISVYGDEYSYHPMAYPGMCCPPAPWGIPPPWVYTPGVHTYPMQEWPRNRKHSEK